jgi:hypothetical protein
MDRRMKDEDKQLSQIDNNAENRADSWSQYERGFYGPLLFVFALSKLKIHSLHHFHMDKIWSLWTKAYWSKK